MVTKPKKKKGEDWAEALARHLEWEGGPANVPDPRLKRLKERAKRAEEPTKKPRETQIEELLRRERELVAAVDMGVATGEEEEELTAIEKTLAWRFPERFEPEEIPPEVTEKEALEEADISSIAEWAFTQPEDFMEKMQALGQTERTEGILKALAPDISEGQLGFLFMPKEEQDKFLTDLRKRGRTVTSQELLRMIWPDVTEEGIAGFFAPTPLMVAVPLVEAPLGSYNISEQRIDKILDYFMADEDEVNMSIKLEGRNEGTEDLLRTLYRDMSDKEIDKFFELTLPEKFVQGTWLPKGVAEYWRLYGAGIGGLVTMAGGAAKRIGMEGVGESLTSLGLQAETVALDVGMGEPNSPEWYAKNMARMAPALIALIAPTLATGGATLSVAGALGAGKTLSTVAAIVASGAVSSVGEGAMEGADAYNEAIRRGYSQDKANEVFDKVMRKNLALLSLTNTSQFGLTFFVPGGKTASFLIKGLTFGFDIASEGLEEGVQLDITREALGDVREFDEEMWNVVKLGMAGGLGFAGVGAVYNTIQNKITGRMTDEQLATFRDDTAKGVALGLPRQGAEIKAMDNFAETKEGEAIIEEATKEQLAEEQEANRDKVPEVVEKITPPEVVTPEIVPEAVTPEVTKEDAFIEEMGKINNRKAELYRELETYPSSKRFTAIQQEFSKLEKDYAKLYRAMRQPVLTSELWNATPVAQRVSNAISVGLGGKVGSKTFRQLTKMEKTALGRAVTPEVAEVRPPVVEELIPEAPYTAREVKEVIEKALPELRVLSKEKGYKITRLTKPPRGAVTAKFRIDGVTEATSGTKVFADNLEQAQSFLETGSLIRYPEVAPPVVEEVVEAPPVEVEVEPIEVKTRRELTGLGRMYQEWWGKLKTAEQTKVSLANFVRESLPMNVRGKYITAVARVKTDAQLDRQMVRVREFAELNAQKVLKVEIRKEIKKAQAKIKDHILKGRFTPDVQRRIDMLTHNLTRDRDSAREKMAENIVNYDSGKLSYSEMLNDNETLNFAGIERMSSEELANTLEYIKILETIGRSERQAKQERETERINIVRTDISGILTGGEGLKLGVGAVPRKGLAAKPTWLDSFVNWQYSLDNLADKLSKLDPVSAPYQSVLSKFVAQAHRATSRQAIGTKEAYNKIKDVVKDVYKVKSTFDINQVLNGLDEEVNLGVFEFTEEYKANHPGATTVEIKMTRDEMIAKYMQMQDYTLGNALTEGMGWSQKVRDTINNTLTVEEKKLSEAIFNFYEDYYSGISEVYREIYNVDMPQNSRYSPRFRDFEVDVIENVLTFQDAHRYAGVTAQSIKARQQSSRPLKFQGATKLLSNHVEQMEHFKAWATTMRDMRRVFGNKEVRQAIEQYHGRGILGLIDKFINQMARGGIETAATNRVADYLRRSFTKSILAIKPVVGLKQVPSLFAYLSEMKATEFFGGVADYWKSPIANFKFLYKNSEGYRARVSQGFERDIRAATAKHGKNKLSGRVGFLDWFLLQIRMMDTFAVTQGMWAKYQTGLKKGLSQADAIAAAEDTTNRTQPSFGIDTLSALQNSGSWLKLMTMFQNQPNKYFRIEADNLRNFKYGRGSRAKAASTILLVHVMLPMLFQYIADAFQWKPERQARAGILGSLNYILIGGQLIQSAWGWLTDLPFDWQVSPVLSTVDEIQKAFFKAKKMIDKGLDPYKDISPDDVATLVEYLAKIGGQLLGAPTPYLVQVEKGIRQKLAEDKDIDIKDFLFSQWALQPPRKDAREKVEEINLKLGEVKEGEEGKPLTEKELKLFTTTDWLREMGNVYSRVLPQDILDDPNASMESKAWAQYEIASSKADILPNIPLYKINTEDNDDTIINYYQQWKSRDRISSLEELKEFDNLYPKAHLGNISRQQYNLLIKYLEAEDKDAFLESHIELKQNVRNEWLKENPLGNAFLALGGDAKILSKEAYDEFNRLIKELDIPDDAIPELTLPPETSIDTHFEYEELVSEGRHGSWEAQLLLLKDYISAHPTGKIKAGEPESYAEWHKLQLSDTPIEALELKVKNRVHDDAYELLETDEQREQYKLDNSGWVDDIRRIEAIDEDASPEIIESWADRGKIIDEFGGGSAEAKIWLLDHKETWDWALDNGLLTDDGSDWNERVLRVNGEMGKLKEGSTAYNRLEYKKSAYELDFPEEMVDTYIDWYTTKRTGYEDDWFLQENKEFYDKMVDAGELQERVFSRVPSREVFALIEEYDGEPDGKARLIFRHEHPALETWFVDVEGYTPVGDRWKEKKERPAWEEKLKELEERVAAL